MRKVSLLDTTLRDGEQTQGVFFSPEEKLHLVQELLLSCRVDRVEVASCKTGEIEKNSIKNIMDWARKELCQDRVEVLSFVDGKQSLDWLEGTGCSCLNLLVKGSLSHCEGQLGKSAEQHIEDIKETTSQAFARGYSVAAYLEDWSRGVQDNPEYVAAVISCLVQHGIKRIYLCDTLGVLSPWLIESLVEKTCSGFPQVQFEYHGHNDYGLATANALAAVKAGASGVHVTLNGLGERAGNASLAEIVVALRDFGIAETSVDEKKMATASRLTEAYSQKTLAENAPILGKNVFTHVSGIHVDGQEKGKLYEGDLDPSRFGREWVYSLGKLSGRKSLEAHLRSLDSYDLSIEEQKRILDKIQEMNGKKRDVTPDDLEKIVKEIKA